MTDNNSGFDRLTHPLRLAAGSHEAGSGKGCAMNVVSFANGDTKITDFPDCSARPLARMVQVVNDFLAGKDGFLSPQDSITVLELGWLTVGTADVPDTVLPLWLVELLDSEWGVIRFADGYTASAIRDVAELCRRTGSGEMVASFEWESARAVPHTLNGVAYAAARAAAAYFATDVSDAATTAAAHATTTAAAHAAYAYAAALNVRDHAELVAFTRTAILRWRELAGLPTETPVDTAAVDLAMEKMSAAPN